MNQGRHGMCWDENLVIGHLGDVELVTASKVQNVVESFVYGVMARDSTVVSSDFNSYYRFNGLHLKFMIPIGAGWQFLVALLNVVCYNVIGLPIGDVLGYKLNLGVQGIRWALLGGSLLQTIVLLIIIIRTNWLKESLQAQDRAREWEGPTAPQPRS